MVGTTLPSMDFFLVETKMYMVIINIIRVAMADFSETVCIHYNLS